MILWLAVASAATQIGVWDPEVQEGSFSTSGVPDLWACGAVASGPLAGFTGSNACGTHLAGNYSNNADSQLGMPTQDLTGLVLPMLQWMQWFSFESGDFGQVEVFEDGVWALAEPVYGYPGTDDLFGGQAQAWSSVQLDLTGVSNLNQVRFRLNSDATVNDQGWYLDDFSLWDGDIAPPRISGLSVLSDTEVLSAPYAIQVQVEDNTESLDVALFYALNGAQAESIVLAPQGGGLFSGSIPAQGHDTQVSYWVEASDGFNLSLEPAQGVYSFRVRLPAPLSLSGPEGLVHDTHADLQWDAPDSVHPVESYRLYRSEALVVATSDTQAEVVLIGSGQDRFVVRAVYAQGEGDPSEELFLDTAVPAALSLSPDQVFQGDRIRTVLTAANLVFVQGELELEFAEGLEIVQVDVRDVDHVVLQIEVGNTALPGFRDLLVESGPNSVLLPNALKVLRGADRPQVEALRPPLGRQGTDLDLEIWTSEPIGTVQSLDLGEGIIVQSVTQPTPNCVRVQGWIELKAPLGDRMVQLDDGQRIWTGQRFKVLDQAPPPVGCVVVGDRQATPLQVLFLPFLGLFYLRRRRAFRPYENRSIRISAT
jgi:hypothetical protein